jgi:tRNA(fMet)-specific endonuclease VapC
LILGVVLSDDRSRKRRGAFVEGVLTTVPIEEYDLDVARSHAGLMVATRRSGRPRGAHNLIIAATAAARERTVVTSDARGFSDLPGVEVRLL